MSKQLIRYLPDDFETRIPVLARGAKLEGRLAVARSSGKVNGFVFARTESGVIYVVGNTNRTYIDLAESFNMNDRDRATWCRLAGVSMPALRELIQGRKRKAEDRQKKRDLDNLRAKAEKAGYRLVRKG